MDTLPIHYLWLIAGVFLLAVEAFGLPGVGVMFFALGALSVGIALALGAIPPDAFVAQGIAFLCATAVSTLLLWKPLQKFRIQAKQRPSYDSLIGADATVHRLPLAKGAQGQVLWSGTILAAELAPDAQADELPVGARVNIAEARGALVLVRPKT